MVKVSIMGKQSHNQHDTVRLHSAAIFLVLVADTPKRVKFSVQSKNHKRSLGEVQTTGTRQLLTTEAI